MHRNFHVIELDLNNFYAPGTSPEGRVFAFNRGLNGQVSNEWIDSHRAEVAAFLYDKWLVSEREGLNLGLIGAARHYFNDEANMRRLSSLVPKSEAVTLAELSLIVHEDLEERIHGSTFAFPQIRKRIFIPNFSISQAREGNYRPHETLDSFFNSESFLLIRMISQHIAANADSEASQEEQNENLIRWTKRYGEQASQEFLESLEFEPKKLYVEGDSPDDFLLEFGHRPYGAVARKITFKPS